MNKPIEETQVAVIGGGIIGAAIARELSKYKVEVCLLEEKGECGFGVTKVCQGLLHGGIAHLTSRTVKYHGEIPFKEYLLQPFNLKERLQNTGRDEFFSLACVLNEEIEQPGRLILAADDEDMEMLELIKGVADDLRIRGVELLDRRGVEALEPLVHKKYIGGLFDSNEAVVLPMSWALAFAENAAANDASIHTQTRVSSIEDKGEVFCIETNRGSFLAKYVVNSAGLYADDIAKMVGDNSFEIGGWKAQLLVMENKVDVSHIMCAVPRPQKGRMLIPTAHDSLIVAHTFAPMTHKKDLSTTRDGLEELLSWPESFVSSITKNDVVSSFAGFLTYNTKNPNDHLLEVARPRFINAAVSAPGLGPAPAIARQVTRMLADEGLVITTRSDFNPYRSKTKRFMELSDEEKRERIEMEPRFGRMVCRCKKVSEQEVREAVRAGATTLDGVKFRTLAGFGRCQGGFCTSRVIKIMADEMKVSPLEITKEGAGSHLLASEVKHRSGKFKGRST